ncbi:MAG: hypothetical protein V4692_13530, partial [Bdellovibrionota bacterium]
ALLGGYIVIQFTKLGQSFKHDKLSIVFFGINVGLFFFIADQLVWKQNLPKPKPHPQAEAQPKQMPTPAIAKVKTSKSSRAKILVHLDGFGNFAQLVDISSAGVRLRGLTANTPDMTGRELEMSLSRTLTLKVRFARKINSELQFEHIGLDAEKIVSLNQWIHQKAA